MQYVKNIKTYQIIKNLIYCEECKNKNIQLKLNIKK